MKNCIAYDNLQVFPFKLERIQELKIIQKINDHTWLTLNGIITEGEKDLYVAITDTQIPIKVTNINAKDIVMGAVEEPAGGDPSILFVGLATKIEVKCIQGVYHLYLEAASYTYLLDLAEHTRSFQDTDQTYEELARKIIESYEQAGIIFSIGESVKIGQFTLQYGETDWEFLKRMASRFRTGLVPADTYDAPKFFFGLPERSSPAVINNSFYSVEKDAKKMLAVASKHKVNVENYEFLYYLVENEERLQIGQSVIFQDKLLYVIEIVSIIEEGVLRHHHKLAMNFSLWQDAFNNPKIAGISILGSVIEVERERVKIHLYIDEKQDKEKAYWFSWASMYGSNHNSGWYCMPEIGDQVRVYFPNEGESSCFALSSSYLKIPLLVKPQNESGDPYGLDRDRLENPEIISFRNLFGKELIFAPDRIIIHSDGVRIILNDADGVEIYTVNNIDIISQEKIAMKAAEIEITGEEKVTINSPKINLAGAAIKIN